MIGQRVPAVAAGLLGVFVAVLVLEHVLADQLSPTRNLVSEYANASGVAGPLMTVGFAAMAVAIALTGVLVLALPKRPAGVVLGALLLVAALGMAGTAVARTQTVAGVVPPGHTLTMTGHIHDLASGVVLFGFFPAVLVSLIRFPRPRWFGIIAVTAAVISLLFTAASATPGLRERIEVAAACVWLLALLTVVRPAELGAPREGTSHSYFRRIS
jgi:hypothetical protein